MWGRTHCSSLLLCLAILAAIHNMNIKSTDKMAICFILQLHVLSEYGANTEWTHNTKTQTAKKSYFRYKKVHIKYEKWKKCSDNVINQRLKRAFGSSVKPTVYGLYAKQ